MIASIAVSAAVYAIDKPYSYKIPHEFQLEPGIRVIVPFGRGNRRCEGIVLEVLDGDDEGLKAIEGILDDEPVLSESFLRMAAFLRERYFCTFYDAVKAMLPAGLWFASEEVYSLTSSVSAEELALDEDSSRILHQIMDLGGHVKKSALAAVEPDSLRLDQAINILKKKQLLHTSIDYTRKIKDKTEQIASLAAAAEETMEYAIRKKRSAPLQYEVLRLLCSVGTGSVKEICYLTGATMATIRRLEKLGFISLSVRPVFRSEVPEYVDRVPELQLNSQQLEVFSALQKQMEQPNPGVALLYGVTGSGKTSVYIRLIQDALSAGQSAMLLVPEISLTPQLVQLLMSHFGNEVAVLHSALRVTERYDEWKRIRLGKARVVVGTRSAVFAPVSDLGLLIVDEEQEHSYKSENSPRYHAREVALYRGSKEGALVVLGSATPSLESMYLARKGIYSLYLLPERYNGKSLPTVRLVDMKQELQQGNSTSISAPLRAALEENISAGRQSILFLNRRGASRCMICVDCGEVSMCPRCSVSLTYHAANQRMMCHHCGYSQPVFDRCPHCGGHMKNVGTGTQRLQQELLDIFPDLGIMRMDTDTISAANSHEAMLERFEKDRIPVLIGTQMVTKGLNFENVTLVGVVDADMSLYIDHYRAAETTFSMLTQVIGRSGRGKQSGQAIIQTLTPEHSVIRLAAIQDYDQFYNLEITLRSLQKAPPFSDIFTIMFVGMFETQTLAGAAAFLQMLDQALQDPAYSGLWTEIFGPSPAPITKINNTFRYRILLHGSNQRPLRQLLSHLLRLFAKDKVSKGVTAFIDVNSYE